MKLFSCQQCKQPLLFENTWCESCQTPLGFLAELMMLCTLTPAEHGYTLSMPASQETWHFCQNHQHGVCNWLVAEQDSFCEACDLNRHIPNLESENHQQAWLELEAAKHRLVYSLLKLRLPVTSKKETPSDGLCFDFISDNDAIPEDAQTITGHSEGLVTINTAEADSAEREQIRKDMNESYRTLIGHFRHEVGHYYWDQLIAKDETQLNRYRALFGDERSDYQQALHLHYQNPLDQWQECFVSQYASSHPWEDWAETWAHYLHIIDTLETAYEFGLQTQPRIEDAQSLATTITLNPYQHEHFSDLLNQYLPLTFAANCLNRSMGQPDLYPFIISPKVGEKLSFIHSLLLRQKGTRPLT